jgi:hypothetical protein
MKLSEITALYSDLDFAYNQAMSGTYFDCRNKSDDGETVAGLKDGKITGAWRPMVCVGSEKWQKSEIERLWEISDDIYFMDFLIDGELSEVSKFLLMKGYRARPVYTQIINLTKPTTTLKAELRKSYKSLVNKDEGIRLVDIGEYKFLHESVKKKSRSIKTWDIQFQMKPCIRRQGDCAVMFYQNDEGVAYYASAVGDNVHALIWLEIICLRDFGFSSVELGEQVYCVGQTMLDGKPATQKNVNISLFKKGFGGKTVTRLILEKE